VKENNIYTTESQMINLTIKMNLMIINLNTQIIWVEEAGKIFNGLNKEGMIIYRIGLRLIYQGLIVVEVEAGKKFIIGK